VALLRPHLTGSCVRHLVITDYRRLKHTRLRRLPMVKHPYISSTSVQRLTSWSMWTDRQTGSAIHVFMSCASCKQRIIITILIKIKTCKNVSDKQNYFHLGAYRSTRHLIILEQPLNSHHKVQFHKLIFVNRKNCSKYAVIFGAHRRDL
jgi:hypothetical protein